MLTVDLLFFLRLKTKKISFSSISLLFWILLAYGGLGIGKLQLLFIKI